MDRYPKKSGKRGPRPQDKSEAKASKKTNGSAPQAVLQCKKCAFVSAFLAEMQEHINGTGHVDYSQVEVTEPHPELFSEPKPVKRDLEVKLNGEELAALHLEAAQIAMAIVEQTGIIANAKAELKKREKDQAEVVARLRAPVKAAEVDCEWQIDIESNSKKLVRLDTGETVTTKALSAEDRSRELARVAKQNNQSQVQAAGA